MPGGPLPSLKLLPHFPAHFVHGRMQDLPRGANYFFFFGGGGFATLGVAMRLLWRFGGMLPRKKILNGTIWCVLEHIFLIFILSKSLKISFFYKNNYKLQSCTC